MGIKEHNDSPCYSQLASATSENDSLKSHITILKPSFFWAPHLFHLPEVGFEHTFHIFNIYFWCELAFAMQSNDISPLF